MKKLIYFVMAFVCITMASCHNKTTNEVVENDSIADTTIVDTTVIDSTTIDSVCAL